MGHSLSPGDETQQRLLTDEDRAALERVFDRWPRDKGGRVAVFLREPPDTRTLIVESVAEDRGTTWWQLVGWSEPSAEGGARDPVG